MATYLSFTINEIANIGSSIASWMSDRGAFRKTFARQAIPMVWDYAEANPFADAGGSIDSTIEKGAMVVAELPCLPGGQIENISAQLNDFRMRPLVFSPDPPYYDKIGYADLSDFFYVWLRRSLHGIWPDLFRRLTTPKENELIAKPYRHAGKDAAEVFFMEGMSESLVALRKSAIHTVPIAIYYAFKQAEIAEEGVTVIAHPPPVQILLDTVTAGSIHRRVWTQQRFSPSPAMI